MVGAWAAWGWARGRRRRNRTLEAMHSHVCGFGNGERLIAIDAEWDVTVNPLGMVSSAGKVQLLQLGYIEANNKPMALLLGLRGNQTLPRAILALLEDPTLTFIGRDVGGDLAKLGRDFNCAASVIHARKVELDTMAKERGVATGRQHTLARLAELTLRISLDKDPTVHMS